MPKTLNPGTEKVAVSFLKTLTGINSIATSLPADPKTWGGEGFYQVQTVGGSPHRHLPQSQPVVVIDVWTPDGRFGTAERLAENIRRAIVDDPTFFGQELDLGADFKNARVLSAWPVTEPRRVENDPRGYGRFTFDVQINYAVVP